MNTRTTHREARPRPGRRTALTLAAAGALILLPAAAPAGHAQQSGRRQDHSAHQPGPAGGEDDAPPQPAGSKFRQMKMKPGMPDVEVLDQHGRSRRFYTDLVKGKTVVIGSFFTSCNYVCLAQGRSFAALQSELGNRLGNDVHLILITRDPWVDSPRVLKKWGEAFKAKPGWTLVTGEVGALKRLIAFFYTDTLGQQELHSSRVFIGSEAADRWILANGLAAPSTLVKDIDQVSR